MSIVAVGALLVDQVAKVSRFPKVDDEVFASDLKVLPGGSAANFAVFCKRLGANVSFIGKVGKDAFGDFLIQDLKEEGVRTRGIKRSNIPTGTVFVELNPKGDRRMVAFSGAANLLIDKDINIKHLNSHDYLYLSNLENIDILDYVARHFRGKVILNPGALVAEKGREAFKLTKRCDIFISSQAELKKLAEEKKLENALEFIQALGPKLVVATLGPKGSIAFDGKNTFNQPAIVVKVRDTTGAGDAFNAGFVYSYMKNKSIDDCLKFGNAAAACAIQEVGARGGLNNRQQVQDLLKRA